MSAVFAMSATIPVYLRARKDCGSAANHVEGLQETLAPQEYHQETFARSDRARWDMREFTSIVSDASAPRPSVA
jgi:hypothetical protein